MNSRNGCGDGSYVPTNIIRGIGFGVYKILMGRGSRHVDHDDGFSRIPEMVIFFSFEDFGESQPPEAQ
jgi:hypothetical protein